MSREAHWGKLRRTMPSTFVIPEPLSPSGRPLPGEYGAYAEDDIAFVEGDDAIAALASAAGETLALFEPLDDDAAAGVTYASGKWTIKEILGHLVDDERIFAFRALSIARGETLELPGFDDTLYVSNGAFEGRPLADLLAEYRSVRQASLTLFAGLPAPAWLRTGTCNAYRASPRGLAFHIAAHELHHLRVLRERYLPKLP